MYSPFPRVYILSSRSGIASQYGDYQNIVRSLVNNNRTM